MALPEGGQRGLDFRQSPPKPAPVAWKKFGGEASYIPVSYGTEQDSFVDDVAKSAERPLCELYVLDFSFNIGQLGGVAVIRVGAPTEAEMKSKKEAFDDAISSTKAAVAEGIVPGGGLALLRCIEGVQQEETKCDGDERTGVQILRRALEILTRQIAENSASTAESSLPAWSLAEPIMGSAKDIAP